MRFLHTADWHVGKKLGRINRSEEYAAVFDELVGIAKEEQVDAVLVAGDLWDRPLPPLDSIQQVIDGLIRLARVAGHVVAIPGNHDSPALFAVLAPLLEPYGVHLVPRIARPTEGGIVTVPSRDGTETAKIAVLPFLHEASIVGELLKGSDDWFSLPDLGTLIGSSRYNDRIRGLNSFLCKGLDQNGIGILMAHYFIEGAQLGGGERKIHLGEQYAASSQSVPAEPQYVALGHIHLPQEMERAGVPTRYSGSTLQLDFSERTHEKQVAIVDIAPGRPAKVRLVSLTAGRKLIRVSDELESLRARAGEFGDAYLDVRVKTSGMVFGLADEVRKFLPNAVMVQAEYERIPGVAELSRKPADARVADLYAAYHAWAHKVAASEELLAEVRSLEEEVLNAAS